MQILLSSLLRWFAPILSFTTEEINKTIIKKKSIHLEKFIKFPEGFKNNELYLKWLKIIKIRNVCNLSVEEKRAKKIIGSSLEASIKISLNSDSLELLKNIDLSEICIVSDAQIFTHNEAKIIVETFKANGSKCPVCWKVSTKPCARHG